MRNSTKRITGSIKIIIMSSRGGDLSCGADSEAFPGRITAPFLTRFDGCYLHNDDWV